MGKIMKEPPVVWWIDFGDDELEFGDFHQKVVRWVETLGLNPDSLTPQAAIMYHAGGYQLHVDEFVQEFEGGRHIDRLDPLNEDQVLTVRRIIPVAEGSWPARPTEVTV
jgi:hypothetical protein